MDSTNVAGRWFRFVLAIAVGVAAGVFYAWRVNPSQSVDAPLDALRIDFKTDWVLMAAEMYSADKDLENAVQHISQLQAGPPEDAVREAVRFAEEQVARGNYAADDLERLRVLHRDLLARAGEVEAAP